MNQEDIIRMARDSGMELYGLGKDREKFVYYLQEFATLVAALVIQEDRERLAKAIEAFPFGDTASSFAKFVRDFKPSPLTGSPPEKRE